MMLAIRQHVRRRHSDTSARSHRTKRPALHQLPFDRAVLADARGFDHRPQSPFDGLRRHRRAGHGYPGYDSIITKDKATIGRILTDNGYHTAWFGKNHNTPEYQASQAGPFDQWPTGMGFEYFYGFMGGDTNQWQPGNLVRNTTPIYPYEGKPRLESDDSDGRRGDRLCKSYECAVARHAVLHQVRAGRDACASSPDGGMGEEDQRHASVRSGLEQAARDHLRETRSGSVSSRRTRN